ncbi:MAG: SDR family oxidoreductase [Pseudomonadota bacterium]
MSDSLFVVTGAASGIGLAMVRRLIRDSTHVLALDINPPPDDCMTSPYARYERCDVSLSEDWQRIANLLQGWMPPTHVHLNAGIQIAPPNAPLAEYRFAALDVERYRRMMGVNVDGVVFGLSHLLPLMPDGGRIVVTSSLAGVTPYGVDPLYAMSKHAVSGLVRSLADELAERDIRINAICPGGIDTGIIPDAQRTDAAVFMSPEHVAEEVMYLMQVAESGKTWAKVAESKPVFIIRAPGDREGKKRA